jgi:hypothetical protein
MNIQQVIPGSGEGTLFCESIPEKTFDYSFGGYYHRERWSRTRRNHYANKVTMRSMQGKSLLEPILEKTFDYSLGGCSHRERWSYTRQNFSFQEK